MNILLTDDYAHLETTSLAYLETVNMNEKMKDVKWSNHVLCRLQQLQASQQLCDANILTTDGNVACHANILAACVPDLQYVLEAAGSPPYVLQFSSLEPAVVTAVVNFMYTGEAECDDQVREKVYCMAEEMGLSVLADLSVPKPFHINTISDYHLEQTVCPSSTLNINDVEQNDDVKKDVLRKTLHADNFSIELDNGNSPKLKIDEATCSSMPASPILCLSNDETELCTNSDATNQQKHSSDSENLNNKSDQHNISKSEPAVSRTRSGRVVKMTVKAALKKESQQRKKLSEKIIEQGDDLPQQCNQDHHSNETVLDGHVDPVSMPDYSHKGQQSNAFAMQSEPKVPENIICVSCDRSFDTVSAMQTHVETCNIKGNLDEMKSDSQTGDLGACDINWDAVKNEKGDFVCTICNKTIKRKASFAIHMLRHKGREHWPNMCTLCGKRFIYRCELTVHLRTHTGEKPLSCSSCSKPYSDPANLRKHQKTCDKKTNEVDTTKKPKKEYKCSECGLVLKYYSNWKVHMDRHTPIHERPYKCTICGHGFTIKHRLAVHMRIHRGEKPLQCQHCGHCYSDPATLRLHVRNKHLYIFNEKCEFCGVNFTSKRELARHALRYHQDCDKPYKCSVCEKSFLVKYTLQTHKRIHKSKYKCLQCDKIFASQSKLDIHESCHTKVKPFKCEFCDATYASQYSLQEHEKRHQSLQQFVCRFCQKAFWRQYELDIHERTHTGEKPYVCKICDRRFVCCSHLRTHERTHRSDKSISRNSGLQFRQQYSKLIDKNKHNKVFRSNRNKTNREHVGHVKYKSSSNEGVETVPSCNIIKGLSDVHHVGTLFQGVVPKIEPMEIVEEYTVIEPLVKDILGNTDTDTVKTDEEQGTLYVQIIEAS